MAHQSLYRKYRPQTFTDVVGQEHIERTLMNAVADGSVAHAYLFTGPRGTGKTTTARILAKALDCEKGPTGEPDGTCEDCIEIAEGRHPDVYELDAASRTGVDNVREEIIGRVNFATTRGRYKIYIIDEVHMLSTAAFNALLKTLEEPPSRVVFILATTHPHKVPETIQSRCQRFDFRRISIDDIAGRLRVIADGEGFEVPDAALTLIARHAAGGMRDAITTLEQLASFTAGSIGLDDVGGLLGEVDSAQLFEIAELVARRNIAECFRWVARFSEEGTDLAEFVRELTGHMRNLYVISAVGEGQGIVNASAEEIARLAAQAAEFGGPDRLARMLDLLGELGAEMRWSSDQRLSLEVVLTRMARPHGDLTLDALAERVEAIELGAALGAAAAPSSRVKPSPANEPLSAEVAATDAPRQVSAAAVGEAEQTAAVPTLADAAGTMATSAPSPTQYPQVESEPAVAAVETHHMGGLDRSAARRAWPEVIAQIKKAKPGRAQLFGASEVEIDDDRETLVIEFAADQEFSIQLAEEPEIRELLQRSLATVMGFAPPVRYQLGKGRVRPADKTASRAAQHDSDPDPEPAPQDDPSSRDDPTPTADAMSPRDPAPQSDLARLLTEGLGAQIVAEHAAAPSATSHDTSDDGDAAQELVSADPSGYDDPELFDEDSREED